MEQRHTELVRDLTVQLTTEREHLSAINVKLEKRIKSLESDENKIKNEVAMLKEENSALETEQLSFHKQLTELLETNIKLNNEISDIEDKYKNDEHFKENLDNDDVIELIDKISSLQLENSNLRDKNDELSAEIEGLHTELTRYKSKKQQNRTNELINEESQSSSGGIKRRGDSPSKVRVTEESPRLGKQRKCNNDDNGGGTTESDTSGDWMALNSELCQTMLTTTTTTTPQNLSRSTAVTTSSSTSGISQDYSSLNENEEKEDGNDDEEEQDERELIKRLKGKLSKIQTEFNEYKLITSEKTNKRCQDLENSLEQMRKEYEDCEDYWQSKLTDERVLFEEEQRLSDEKLAELLRKMTEYEEQFAATNEKDGRLSPIDESSRWEQQFTDLEAEIEEIKEHARKLLDDKDNEVKKLQNKIVDLQKKLKGSEMMIA